MRVLDISFSSIMSCTACGEFVVGAYFRSNSGKLQPLLDVRKYRPEGPYKRVADGPSVGGCCPALTNVGEEACPADESPN